MSAAPEFRHSLRVRYAECDMQGHVFFAHYAAYLDVAIIELWRARAGGWQPMVDAGHDLVVAALEVEFRGSAVFDDVLDVVVGPAQVGTTSVRFAWRIERGGEQLVGGTIRYVCVDVASHVKQPVPAALREAFA